ncbi:MAG TPA: SDR family oxidoreductase [Bacteroidia bacterium]|nr:SDR family oxidoreductase [Bacteroidia bacterium]
MPENKFHTVDISGKSFLVTGGAGFIGSHVTEYLLRHNAHLVRVLDNLSTGFEKNMEGFKSNPRFEFFHGDISNYNDCVKACAGIDFVSHQAALGSVPRSIEHPLNTHLANCTGFVNMLVATRDARVKNFVYASSSSVYGDEPSLPKKETKIGSPLSPYAVTKLTNELYAANFSRVYGMNTIGLRYFNIFGPGQSPEGQYAAAIPLFLHAMFSDGEIFIDGDGSQTRDFTFIDNAVQANIKALFTANAGCSGRVFNIAAGKNISVMQLFNMLKEITGYKKLPSHRPPRKGDVKDSLADISLAEKYFGFKPLVSVEEGLRITADYFKENLRS